MINPRRIITKMNDYLISNTRRRYHLPLDLNENTKGCSPKVIRSLRNLRISDLSIYPEYGEFKEKLGRYLKTDKNNILLTNSADEGIKLIMETFLGKGEEVIIPVPTFSMFKFYASLSEANIKEISYNKDLTFPTNEMIKTINEKTKMIILVNPNNPTGTKIPKKYLLKILRKAKKFKIPTVIDEAYYEFYGKSSKYLINYFDNILITRTFSKAFGLAGIRLGYIISNNNNIRFLAKASSPYSVSSLSIRTAESALNDEKFVNDYVKEVRKNKNYLITNLRKLGIPSYFSNANFVLADFGQKNEVVFENLKSKGILVKNLSKYPLLKGCIRITIGTKQQCTKILNEIKEMLDRKVILFDMDGVLADVSMSYRMAIKKTVEYFVGRNINFNKIQELKENTGFNNDWSLTYELIRREYRKINFNSVKRIFQKNYKEKYIENEELIIKKNNLLELSKKYQLGIITGRPKEEAYYFLDKFGIKKLFSCIICKEDAKEKPDPQGIKIALKELNTLQAIYYGDSIDDMKASKKAGIEGYGVIPPGVNENRIRNLENNLIANGAKKVLIDINEVKK